MENIIIGIIFVGAVAYLVNLVRKNFSPKQTGCSKGCGACGAIDADKIVAQFQEIHPPQK